MALKTILQMIFYRIYEQGKRQYNVTENSNGTKSLEDATDYQSVGSTFSAKDMNETNAAVNQAHNDIRELTENMQNRFKVMKFQLPPDTTANTKYTLRQNQI